ncbi:MAG TPA: ribonuclease PH [Syntrophales bacterium]|nr:ribonuclease PH [Syntrophales bacterium]HOX93751.1 ribonuclease PH [Syntrophales bacterium]HPI55892.1 ribonuclease PH [Syntrophales bacterium]HPN23617.1 ribonuclease PH [Syntrophales bacterium]HQM27858.1 ribonuclease PH [Syntrophales bacterium]
MRAHGRRWNEMREVRITGDFLKYPAGAILIEMGNTKVICTASVDEAVPPFLKNTGRGWVTAEYAMIPGSTHVRTTREAVRGRQGGRTLEIQRLIGRSLRAVTDLTAFGERTLVVDCDVIQADGGTRTAAITGGCLALIQAFGKMKGDGLIHRMPVKNLVCAVSVGLVEGRLLLDLDYKEDSSAEVDMNFVITRGGLFVEIQGTAEGTPFSRELHDQMIDLALLGSAYLTGKQIELAGDMIN